MARIPNSYPTSLLKYCREYWAELRENRRVYQVFLSAVEDLSPRGVTKHDVAALVIGLRILESFRRSTARQAVLERNRKFRRNTKTSRLHMIAAQEAGRSASDRLDETLTEDGIEIIKTMLVVAFMLKADEDKIRKRTWKPLVLLVCDCFRLGSKADDAKEGYEPSKDVSGLVMLLLGTLRRRVRYLREKNEGDLPELKASLILAKVDKALRPHLH